LHKKTIESVFKCKVLDGYGASDGGITAFEHHDGFYEVGYNCLVKQQSRDEESRGPIIVTDLLNYSMPLINYQLGDEIEMNNEKNSGFPYNGQIINKVLGRISDIIELENGSVLTGPGFTILFKDLPVEYYNIRKTGLNTITCKIKTLPEYNTFHEQLIKNTFAKQMGEEAKLIIVYTEDIIISENGKVQYFGN